ncbi:MAG TPA: hypothetical protein VFT12_01460 [Thermoanaerobaculia bacterium]|nr:hypothetical protein [Thermoanaerobaculia bacterium]
MHRLERNFPRGVEWMFRFAGGVAIFALASAGALYALYRLFFVETNPDLMFPVLAALGGFLALFGASLIWGGLRQFAASRVPEPIIEIDCAELVPGARVWMKVVQPGPADFEYFSVVLVGEKHERESVVVGHIADPALEQHRGLNYEPPAHSQVKMQVWKSEITTFLPLVRQDNLSVARGERFEKSLTFDVPEDATPTAEGGIIRHTWKVEVSGHPAVWADTLDEYPVIVRQPQRERNALSAGGG